MSPETTRMTTLLLLFLLVQLVTAGQDQHVTIGMTDDPPTYKCFQLTPLLCVVTI